MKNDNYRKEKARPGQPINPFPEKVAEAPVVFEAPQQSFTFVEGNQTVFDPTIGEVKLGVDWTAIGVQAAQTAGKIYEELKKKEEDDKDIEAERIRAQTEARMAEATSIEEVDQIAEEGRRGMAKLVYGNEDAADADGNPAFTTNFSDDSFAGSYASRRRLNAMNSFLAPNGVKAKRDARGNAIINETFALMNEEDQVRLDEINATYQRGMISYADAVAAAKAVVPQDEYRDAFARVFGAERWDAMSTAQQEALFTSSFLADDSGDAAAFDAAFPGATQRDKLRYAQASEAVRKNRSQAERTIAGMSEAERARAAEADADMDSFTDNESGENAVDSDSSNRTFKRQPSYRFHEDGFKGQALIDAEGNPTEWYVSQNEAFRAYQKANGVPADQVRDMFVDGNGQPAMIEVAGNAAEYAAAVRAEFGVELIVDEENNMVSISGTDASGNQVLDPSGPGQSTSTRIEDNFFAFQTAGDLSKNTNNGLGSAGAAWFKDGFGAAATGDPRAFTNRVNVWGQMDPKKRAQVRYSNELTTDEIMALDIASDILKSPRAQEVGGDAWAADQIGKLMVPGIDGKTGLQKSREAYVRLLKHAEDGNLDAGTEGFTVTAMEQANEWAQEQFGVDIFNTETEGLIEFSKGLDKGTESLIIRAMAHQSTSPDLTFKDAMQRAYRDMERTHVTKKTGDQITFIRDVHRHTPQGPVMDPLSGDQIEDHEGRMHQTVKNLLHLEVGSPEDANKWAAVWLPDVDSRKAFLASLENGGAGMRKGDLMQAAMQHNMGSVKLPHWSTWQYATQSGGSHGVDSAMSDSNGGFAVGIRDIPLGDGGWKEELGLAEDEDFFPRNPNARGLSAPAWVESAGGSITVIDDDGKETTRSLTDVFEESSKDQRKAKVYRDTVHVAFRDNKITELEMVELLSNPEVLKSPEMRDVITNDIASIENQIALLENELATMSADEAKEALADLASLNDHSLSGPIHRSYRALIKVIDYYQETGGTNDPKYKAKLIDHLREKADMYSVILTTPTSEIREALTRYGKDLHVPRNPQDVPVTDLDELREDHAEDLKEKEAAPAVDPGPQKTGETEDGTAVFDLDELREAQEIKDIEREIKEIEAALDRLGPEDGEQAIALVDERDALRKKLDERKATK